MVPFMAKSGLGRGLGALIGSNTLSSPQPIPEKGERVQDISANQIVPSPYQPRKVFSDEKIEEMAQSIQKQGIIQPLIVRKVDGKFELIAGERRWRASQKAGLSHVPVIVRSASDREVLELALIENLQRADLSPIEEAEGYALLIQSFKASQEEIAARVGKPRATIANAVRLLSLPDEIKKWIGTGQLSVGHGKVILSLARSSDQLKVAHRVIKDHLTVRQTEKLVQSLEESSPKSKKSGKSGATSADWRDLEQRIQRKLGTRVQLHGNGETGRIELQYFSADELHRLLGLLGVLE